MSLGFKKHAVIAFLILFAVWPATHHVLAQRYQFDPWRFFGWAMYSTPDPNVEIYAAEVYGEKAKPIDLANSPALQETKEFAHRRSILGKWAPPHDLAESLMRHYPESEGMMIQIRRLVLDRETATIKPQDTVFRFDRGTREPRFVKVHE